MNPPRGLLVLGFAFLVAACGNVPPPRPMFPDLSFAHLEALRFEAAQIEVVNEYIPPLKAPNVEHEMPLKLGDAATRWTRERLKAAGGATRTVRATIKSARVIETDLARTPGLRGAFTTDQAQRYDGEIEMIVELRSERGLREAFASATVRRSTTVAEGITMNDRERVFYGLVEQLMAEFNTEMEKNIRQFMSLHLR